MAEDEIVRLWEEVGALHEAVSGLIELQRASLGIGASESVLRQLDELRDRLRERRAEIGRRAGQVPHFGEIDVERLNVREKDGTLRLAISNTDLAPGPVVSGKVGERSGGNQAGIIFYNDEGDECGGLYHHGRSEDGHYSAGAGLLFDQYKQDQVIGVWHSDEDGRRFAGLVVWDRPDLPLNELMERYEAARRLPEGSERDRAFEQMQAEGLFGATRLYVGKLQDRSAVLRLCDPEGRDRLRLVVDASGGPRLELLDEDGRMTFRLPEADRAGGEES